jgi:5'-deoxynucleotidase YfbR-like HD superfamily hydrolase
MAACKRRTSAESQALRGPRRSRLHQGGNPVDFREIRIMATREPPRAWQRMLSGRRLDLLNPSPLDIEISDIAHGLARVARWNGQTIGPHAFSVAQHCLLVEDMVGQLKPRLAKPLRLAALLHDAPEYVIGDLISPFKAAVGIDYKDFELKLLAAIHIRFAVPAQLPRETLDLIKRADRFAAFYEATQLAGFDLEEARHYFGFPARTLRAPHLAPLATADAEKEFLARFRRLTA